MMSNAEQIPTNGEEPVSILQEILGFLGGVATPDAWLDEALRQQEILLLDHRNLEYKAAQTALSLIWSIVQNWKVLRCGSGGRRLGLLGRPRKKLGGEKKKRRLMANG